MDIKAIRGTKDILPDEVARWVAVENLARDLFARYGYSEIRTPIIEEASLFKRAVGDTTDIVQKQMYTFSDRGERSITLRPEGTAPVVRAYIENNLDKKQALTKLFYIGAMFRAERPQAGRQRQFHQLGVEAIGSTSPYLDAEAISLIAVFLEKAGVKDFTIKLNSLGCGEDKIKFAELLKKELKSNVGSLCEDCQSRFEKNTLRILDCKNPECKKIVGANLCVRPNEGRHTGLPLLCEDCNAHFQKTKECLGMLNIKFTVDSHLVRGLDYYTGTVFEVVPLRHCEEPKATKQSPSSEIASPRFAGLAMTEKAQDAIAAGGRYDNLVKDLGGSAMPAVGFAIGIERLLLATENRKPRTENRINIYLATLGDAARKKAFELAAGLRKADIACIMEYDDKSLKAQLKAASNQGCAYAAILGDDELKKNKIVLRDMTKREQREIELVGFVEFVKQHVCHSEAAEGSRRI